MIGLSPLEFMALFNTRHFSPIYCMLIGYYSKMRSLNSHHAYVFLLGWKTISV